MKMEGKTALVTGAARGIGQAAAQLLAREGARVMVVDLDAAEGERTADTINKQGGTAKFCAVDVSNEDQVKEVVSETRQQFGRLDVLINNAGINFVGFLEEMTEKEWDRVMGVNLKSIFFFVKYSVPLMRAVGGGSIVNVGSIGSLVGQFKTPAYIASKGGVLLLTKSLALDYGRDQIRVNCVCPGITDTPMLREHLQSLPNPDEVVGQRVDRVPLGRLLEAEDIARAILFLASADSAGVSGTALLVDAGLLAASEYSGGWTR